MVILNANLDELVPVKKILKEHGRVVVVGVCVSSSDK